MALKNKRFGDCPFCLVDNNVMHTYQSNGTHHRILCQTCNALGPRAYDKSEAVRLWKNATPRKNKSAQVIYWGLKPVDSGHRHQGSGS